jgi:iron complex outermembrane recepter protein
MNNSKRNLNISRSMASGLVFAGGLFAPVPAVIGQEMMLEEVVVTARRREESLQETPVAVSAFGEDEMRAAQINGVADLTAHVPGLARREGRKEADLSIRGVGQRVRGANADPAVGVYVDNIFIPRSDAQLVDAINLQSVQVLRGPQGTLFGKNTAGGALLLTTKKPGDEYEGFATGNFGDLGRTKVRLGSSGPLTDQLSAGIVVDYAKEDGYREDAETGIDYGDTNRRSVLGQFGYVGDSFGADLMLFWGERNENFAPVNCVLANATGALQQFTAPGDSRDYRDVCELSESLVDDEKVLMDRQGSPWEMTNYMAGLTLQWDLGDVQLKSITGYLYQDDILQGGEVDAGPIFVINSRTEPNRHLQAAGFDTENEERTFYSQEFQLVGAAFDDDFTYTVGVFASKEEIDDAPGGGMIGPGGYLGTVDAVTGLITASPLVRNLETSSYDNESWAIFGQGIYSFNDNWQLTLGLRYTEETKEATQLNYVTQSGVQEGLTRGEFDALETALQDIVIDPLVRAEDETWEEWTPAVTLTHFLPESLSGDVLESGMVYFSVSEGFKAGGFTPFGEEFLPFDPEEILSYELGAKLDLLDRTLRINTSIYYSEYDDIQLRVTRTIEDDSPVGSTTLDGIINAAQATMTGAEIEATWLPTNNLMFMATGAWIDADYDEFFDEDGAGLVDRSDEDLAYIPEVTVSLIAQYTFDTDFGEITPRISGFYTDEVFIGLDAAAAAEEIAVLEDYTLWNFRIALKPNAIEDFEVAAYVNNISDKSYFGTGLISTGGVGAAGLIPGKQQTWGVELAYSW